jgi:hypothetical protein
MSEYRRSLMKQNNTTPGPYDPSLIFYCPLTEGDFKEKITGNIWQFTGDGSYYWDPSLDMYHFITPTTTYQCIAKIAWSYDTPIEGFTIIAECMRIRGTSIGMNGCRPFLFGEGNTSSEQSPEWDLCPGSSDRWPYNTKIVAARYYTSSIDKAYEVGGSVYWNKTNYRLNELNNLWYPYNSFMSLGCVGHRNFRQAHFGIKNIRIYNRTLSENEILIKAITGEP